MISTKAIHFNHPDLAGHGDVDTHTVRFRPGRRQAALTRKKHHVGQQGAALS